MKQSSILFFTLLLLIWGCGPDSKKEAATTITPRNTAIQPGNAYNDLFLDSSAVEKFITSTKVNDTIADRMRSFYNARNFEFAWFDHTGLTEQALSFRSLYDYASDTVTNKGLEYRLDALITGENDSALTASDPQIVKTELQLTRRFVQYFLENFHEAGGLHIKQLESFIPAQRQELLSFAAAVVKDKDQRKLSDNNADYGALHEQVKTYAALVEKGGWDTLPVQKKRSYKKGDNDAVIAGIKKRLYVSGEFKEQDTTLAFTEGLEQAVKAFQQSHGYTASGVVSDTLLREMNIPARFRLQQLLINMERMRWMPASKEGKLITVNIPEFMLHVREGGKQVMDMAVVVGREGHSTVMFSGELNQIVFSPYWNIPSSIVRKEILNKSKQYLASQGMETTGTRNGLPVIRQKPGPKNALGRVKFLFPNSYNIYFHDTPAKGLFNRDKRAYSHGCIRLADPVKLAQYVLADNSAWPPERIDSAMNAGKEKWVKIKDPVPVLITYYTAWQDENKVLQFREDIYEHDHKTAGKMFSDPQ
ncbi:L,D-transpeptidase family protein [Chitinophaga pendula]|nr:hypothetical protein CK934_19625 [Chitinophaga sp. MD30]UCJ10237.1 L,D-transpeptidase family protein [Chitinophaga pendula]